MEKTIGIDLKEIEARFGTGAVYGTRLAGSSDMSFLSVDELKTFKKMTGGDSTDMTEMNSYRVATRVAGSLHYCYPNRASPYSGYGENIADAADEPVHTPLKIKVCKDK